jgi:hypothetical protein
MDPNETLRLAREALREGRSHDAADYYADLMMWISTGGYVPEGFGNEDQYARRL